MKSYRKELWFEIRQRREFINITPRIEECLSESGVKEGLCLVNAMHITSSVFINDESYAVSPAWFVVFTQIVFVPSGRIDVSRAYCQHELLTVVSPTYAFEEFVHIMTGAPVVLPSGSWNVPSIEAVPVYQSEVIFVISIERG